MSIGNITWMASASEPAYERSAGPLVGSTVDLIVARFRYPAGRDGRLSVGVAVVSTSCFRLSGSSQLGATPAMELNGEIGSDADEQCALFAGNEEKDQ